MIARSFCPRSNSVNDCLKYQRKVLTAATLLWLSNLPVFLQVNNLSLVHGGWTNPIDEYLEADENYFSKIEGEFFASGHSHMQRLQKFNDKTYCNPGSVGQTTRQ